MITRADEVRSAVKDVVENIILDYQDQPDTDRETLIERLDEECDSLWGSLVKHGRLDEYDVDDLLETVQACSCVIEVAKQDAWVEDDSGLWDGMTYGVVPSMAYFSLRNILYKALESAGYDSNHERPFGDKEDE